MYAAELKMLRRISRSLTNKSTIFLLEISNVGGCEWQRCELDWIRIGCKIYKEDSNSNMPLMELRQELPHVIKSGDKFQALFKIDNGFLQEGRYKLKFDIVNELQFWFEDKGSTPLITEHEITDI
jgi:hypothetical protein